MLPKIVELNDAATGYVLRIVFNFFVIAYLFSIKNIIDTSAAYIHTYTYNILVMTHQFALL